MVAPRLWSIAEAATDVTRIIHLRLTTDRRRIIRHQVIARHRRVIVHPVIHRPAIIRRVRLRIRQMDKGRPRCRPTAAPHNAGSRIKAAWLPTVVPKRCLAQAPWKLADGVRVRPRQQRVPQPALAPLPHVPCPALAQSILRRDLPRSRHSQRETYRHQPSQGRLTLNRHNHRT